MTFSLRSRLLLLVASFVGAVALLVSGAFADLLETREQALAVQAQAVETARAARLSRYLEQELARYWVVIRKDTDASDLVRLEAARMRTSQALLDWRQRHTDSPRLGADAGVAHERRHLVSLASARYARLDEAGRQIMHLVQVGEHDEALRLLRGRGSAFRHAPLRQAVDRLVATETAELRRALSVLRNLADHADWMGVSGLRLAAAVAEHNAVQALSAERLACHINAVVRASVEHLATGDPVARQAVDDSMENAALALVAWETRASVGQHGASPGEPAQTQRLSAALAHVKELLRRIADLRAEDRHEAAVVAEGRLTPLVEDIVLLEVARVLEHEEVSLTRGLDLLDQSLRRASLVLGVLAVALVAAAVLGGLTTYRAIVLPIREIQTAAMQFGKGDLDSRVVVRASDELGALAAEFNRMAADVVDSTVSRDEVRGILESMTNMLIVTDLQGHIVTINTVTLSLLGYREAEILGLPLEAIMTRRPPELDLTAVQADWKVSDLEAVCRTKDGRELPVLLQGAALVARDGSARGVTLVALDLTDRRRAEEENARLALAVERAAESIIVTDPSGNIVYVNPAFERVSGYNREESLGRNCRFLRSGKHDAAFFRRFWATLARGEVWQGRMTNRHKQGNLYEEELTVSPVCDANGRLVNYVAVKRDVTHEVDLTERLAQAQKMEAVGMLAGGVAHDFNNILGVIQGHSELLLKHLGEQDPRSRRVEQIKAASERAASLTHQLLAFSRKQVLEPKVLDLNAVVTDIGKMLRHLIGEDIELVTTLDSILGRVKADRAQIEQVILNLAVNARDAMPRGGKLIIQTSNVEFEGEGRTVVQRGGSHVMLVVSDTGRGMATDLLPHVFEPFFTTKEQKKGTGLGLAMVYGVVKQSGGEITAYSEPGRGSTFKIYLPRVEEPEDVQEIPLAHVQPLPPGSGTILLVEDDEALRGMVREVLEEHGYTVVDGATADEGLSAARLHDGPLHLLLTDVVMPQKSGLRMAASLKRLRPQTKVLYMSGYTDEAVGNHGVFEGDSAFLQKPFTTQGLLAKVREVIDAPANPSA